MADPCRDWGQNLTTSQFPGSRFKSAITSWKCEQNRNGPKTSLMGPELTDLRKKWSKKSHETVPLMLK